VRFASWEPENSNAGLHLLLVHQVNSMDCTFAPLNQVRPGQTFPSRKVVCGRTTLQHRSWRRTTLDPWGLVNRAGWLGGTAAKQLRFKRF
jgi:hypothetical protein